MIRQLTDLGVAVSRALAMLWALWMIRHSAPEFGFFQCLTAIRGFDLLLLFAGSSSWPLSLFVTSITLV